jgi:hypothetical protein
LGCMDSSISHPAELTTGHPRLSPAGMVDFMPAAQALWLVTFEAWAAIFD